jgi:hypothetical protein
MEKPDLPWKHFLIAFVIALVVYVASYSFIEYRRERQGPWEVTFSTNTLGQALIQVKQPKLKIDNVMIVIAHTNVMDVTLPTTIKFGNPAKAFPYPVPFGKAIFLDTTFLPGAVTMVLCGHEIELLPRTLSVDRIAYPWKEQVITLKNPLPIPFPEKASKSKKPAAAP